MSFGKWNFFFVKKGSPIATDTSPLSTDPDGAVAAAALGQAAPFDTRTFATESGNHNDSLAIISVGGACTVRVWAKDADAGWVPIKTGVAVTTTGFTYISVPANAHCWIEVTANAGSATALYAGYSDVGGEISTSQSVSVTSTPVTSSTATQTSVAGSAADVTILAANGARLGATIMNDSTSVLYLLVASGTSSTTNYTVQLATNDYFEVPFNYTGVIKGIWASAAGSARVTEYVA